MVAVSACSVGSRAPGASRPPRISALSRDRTFSARLLDRFCAIGGDGTATKVVGLLENVDDGSAPFPPVGQALLFLKRLTMGALRSRGAFSLGPPRLFLGNSG